MINAQLSPEWHVTDLGEATVLNYQKSRKLADRAYEQAKAREDEADKKVISGMVADCDYAIEWLRTGRRPGNKRGIERRAAYQREKLMDPLMMQAYVQKGNAGSPSNLSDWERFQIEDALTGLSERERECFVLSRGECFSYNDIAKMLGIKKASVKEYVERAQVKISKNLQNSLFL